MSSYQDVKARLLRRRRAIAVIVVPVCLVVLGYHRWTHPSVLESASGGGGFSFAPLPLAGSTFYGGILYPSPDTDPETLTLHSVTAHFAVNTARAHASFVICVNNPRAGASLGAGAGPSPLADECRSTRPVTDGAKYHLVDGTKDNLDPNLEYVVLVVTPTRPGKVRIDGISVNYSRAWGWGRFGQHGTERFDAHWQLTVKP